MSWLKDITDKLAANLREAGWPSSALCPHNGRAPRDGRWTCVECGHVGKPVAQDLINLAPAQTMLTPSVADPVGSMLGAVTERVVNPHATPDVVSPDDLDHIVSTCTHPGIQTIKFPNGDKSYHCTRCAKVWSSLQEGIDNSKQTQPISTTEIGEGGIPAAVEQLASEMSYRLGETVAQLVAATNPGTAVAMHQYEDFASMPSVRSPLPVREGGQTQNINMPEQDPDLAGVRARIEARVAQREAKDATARRNKAMEDAARAAAAAFDAGIEAERNPVKLDGDRKLKAI